MDAVTGWRRRCSERVARVITGDDPLAAFRAGDPARVAAPRPAALRLMERRLMERGLVVEGGDEHLVIERVAKAPTAFYTARLAFRRPHAGDANAIFERYASDPEVTRYLAWPRHRSLAETHAFLAFSDSEWKRWPAGPYLIFSRADGMLVGSTGLAFETSYRAATGYVLARDAWGRGYATEALGGIVEVAPRLGVRRLYAVCHHEHRASARVLEKCGFEREGMLRRFEAFPNLQPPDPTDVLCYAKVF